MTLESGFALSEYNTVRKIANIISVNLWINGTITANASTIVGKLENPDTYPTFAVRGVCVSNTTAAATGTFLINTNGDVAVRFGVNVGSVILSASYIR